MRIRTDTGTFVNEAASSCGWSEGSGLYAIASALNGLAAADAVCAGVEAQIIFPVHADNSKAYAMEKNIRKICKERGIELQGMKIKKYPLTEVPVVMVSAAGYSREELSSQSGGTWDQAREIVLVKWSGMEGMLRIADEKKDELRQRFAPVFLRQIHFYKKELFAEKELEIAKNAGAAAVRQITEGGIFAALWELAKETGRGIAVDLRRMPVLQETIEVCEYFRINPYQLASAGSFLMLAEDGKKLTDVLRTEQITASVIGTLTDGNDKVIHNGEDVRYLDRPSPDEIFKLWQSITTE